MDANVRRTSGIATAIALLLLSGPACAWQVALSGSRTSALDGFKAAALDPNGDVVLAGLSKRNPGDCVTEVMKTSGTTGATLWRREIPGAFGSCYVPEEFYGNGYELVRLAVDDAGDVVLAGLNAVIVKLSGADGKDLWRAERFYDPQVGFIKSPLYPHALALDGAGDVLVAGITYANPNDDDDLDPDFAVVKLARATGTEIWRREINGDPRPFDPENPYDNYSAFDAASALAVDAAGDVIAAGYVQRGSPDEFTVIKLDGGSGADLWRYAISGFASHVAVDAAGDVVAAGGSTGGSTVVRLEGTSGTELWQHAFSAEASFAYSPRALALDPAGDVIVASTDDYATRADSIIAKLSAATGSLVWLHDLRGPSYDEVPALGVDGAGDVVAVGSLGSADPGIRLRFSVLKLAATSGTPRWQQTIDGTAEGRGFARAVAIDPAGDVLAAGTTVNVATDADATVVRLAAADGAVRWRRDVQGMGTADDAATAVAVDPAGDIVAAGTTTNAETYVDFAVVKLTAADGHELWRQEISGTGRFNRFTYDAASAVTVDRRGDVIAAGSIENEAFASDFAVVKLDGRTGTERWRQLVRGDDRDDPDGAFAVTLDARGDVIAAGFLYAPDVGARFTVVKLDGATGAERWRRAVPGTVVPYSGWATSVVVDAAGDVLAAGTTYNETTGDFVVVKIAGTSGDEVWRQVIDGTTPAEVGNSDYDLARAIAVDASGDVVATGSLANTGTDSDLFVVKLAGTTGAEQWRRTIDGGGAGADFGRALRVDDAGDVAVAGITRSLETGYELTVVKLAGPTGSEIWRRALAGTVSGGDGIDAAALALDGAGDVIATGATRNAASGFDLTVAKLARQDGAERWRRTVSGTASVAERGSRYDYASAVAVDPVGNVTVAGATVNTGSAADFTVLMLGADGGEQPLPCGTVCSIAPCAAAPLTTCRRPAGGAAALQLDDRRQDRRDRLAFRWLRGADTPLAAFGDPTTAEPYSFCLYEESGAVARVILGASVGPGGTCGLEPCWRRTTNPAGFVYVSDAGTPDGLTRVTLQAHDSGESAIAVRGAGPMLALPPLPLATPLRVQLQTGGAQCWEAAYSAGDVVRNDTARFKARTRPR